MRDGRRDRKPNRSRIADQAGADAATLFTGDVNKAKAGTAENGGGTSRPYYGKAFRGLGDEAFCTTASVGTLPAGVLVREGEALLLTEAASGPREPAALVERRAAGEPLEQVLGWAEFCGLRLVAVRSVSRWPPSSGRVALDGGSDGLDVVRRIADGASHWLAAEGSFLVEISRRQAPAVVGLLARAGLAPQVVTSTS